MVEVGIINRELARILSQQGHQDELMVVDAGFAIPKGLEVVDLSLTENVPLVLDVLYSNVILVSGAGDKWYCEK